MNKLNNIYEKCEKSLEEIFLFGAFYKYLKQNHLEIPLGRRTELIPALETLEANKKKALDINIIYKEVSNDQSTNNYDVRIFSGVKFEFHIKILKFKVMSIDMKNNNEIEKLVHSFIVNGNNEKNWFKERSIRNEIRKIPKSLSEIS